MGKTSTDLHQLYEKPGKRQFTRLVLDVAAHDGVRTLGLFWGGGGDSRLAVAAGFDVLAADVDPDLWEAMAEDGKRHGYATFAGNVRRLRDERDMWHADFMNTPNPDNFRTVRHLSKHTRKWLAVTVATDHIKNPEMQGEALMATLPGWLTFAAEGFTLEYFGWYKRNAGGLRMWTALLQRRSGKGTSHQVLPVQIAYSLKARGYWASRPFYELGLLRHRYSPRNPNEKMADAVRYQRRKDARPTRLYECVRCGAPFEDMSLGRPSGFCSDSCRLEHRAAYRRDYYYSDREAAIARSAAYRRAHLKGEVTLSCFVCRGSFSTLQRNARYCSSSCRSNARLRAERDRRRRLAAVSGTAAEAIKIG